MYPCDHSAKPGQKRQEPRLVVIERRERLPARLFEDQESGELLPAAIEGEPKVQVGAVRIMSE